MISMVIITDGDNKDDQIEDFVEIFLSNILKNRVICSTSFDQKSGVPM